MQPCGVCDKTYAEDMGIVKTRLQWSLWILFLILLLCVPLFMPATWMVFANRLLLTLITVIGLQLLVGYCGQISLMHAATMAVGAYSSAIMAQTFGLPFWLSVPCGVLAAGLIGMVFGAPSLRVKGYYLALVTLGAHFIIMFAISHSPAEITGGVIGLNVPEASIGGLTFASERSWYYLLLAVVLGAGLFAQNLVRGKVGRAFVAVRDNDLTAEGVGIDVYRCKLLAFFICSLYAGLAGSLTAYYVGFTNVEQFAFWETIWFLGMVIIGGLGSVLGTVFGVTLWRLLEEGVTRGGSAFVSMLGGTIFPLLNVFFAVMIIVFLILEPRGLAHRWALFKRSYRLWPFSY